MSCCQEEGCGLDAIITSSRFCEDHLYSKGLTICRAQDCWMIFFENGLSLCSMCNMLNQPPTQLKKVCSTKNCQRITYNQQEKCIRCRGDDEVAKRFKDALEDFTKMNNERQKRKLQTIEFEEIKTKKIKQ